jgi:hypothetical protein
MPLDESAYVVEAHKDLGVRFLAFLLAGGGLLGVGLASLMAYQYIQQHWVYIFIWGTFAAVFAWSALTGVRLWRGLPSGWKWAIILFIAQIPVLTVPGFSYEFYTGFAIKLVGGKTEDHSALELGSSITAYLDIRINELTYGINLFALGAAAYLAWKKRNKALQPALGK